MISRLAKRHDREERTVHHRQPNPLKPLVHLAENNLAQLIFQPEILCLNPLHPAQHLIDGGVRGVEHKRRAVNLLRRLMAGVNLIAVTLFDDPADLPPELQLHIGQSADLLEQIVPQNMRVIGIFFRQKSAVTHAGLKILLRRQIHTGDPCALAELPKFPGIRPGKMTGCSVDLLKFVVYAEAVILHETLKIPGRLHGRGERSGIMISHMHTGLIDISRPRKGCLLYLKHRDLLPLFAAVERRVQAIQPRADDQFIAF